MPETLAAAIVAAMSQKLWIHFGYFCREGSAGATMVPWPTAEREAYLVAIGRSPEDAESYHVTRWVDVSGRTTPLRFVWVLAQALADLEHGHVDSPTCPTCGSDRWPVVPATDDDPSDDLSREIAAAMAKGLCVTFQNYGGRHGTMTVSDGPHGERGIALLDLQYKEQPESLAIMLTMLCEDVERKKALGNRDIP